MDECFLYGFRLSFRVFFFLAARLRIRYNFGWKRCECETNNKGQRHLSQFLDDFVNYIRERSFFSEKDLFSSTQVCMRRRLEKNSDVSQSEEAQRSYRCRQTS